ncbi:hypothetical protein IAR55_001195 [Kwoniella newhampshirensis]|uniref:Uncharacterized protein n=1 Tax=Kwoniella newhampshirensis TaxID=1651941 RepID=A0AAW0Z4Z9_9TREE
MAHPLTQQPPSSLPFAFAARPSPLAFGFGLPSASGSSSAGVSSPVRHSGNAWANLSPSPAKATPSRFRLNSSPTATHTSLKRSRPSRSPSSSPPLTPTSSTSAVSHTRYDQSTSKVDLADVAGLALQDTPSVSAGKHKLPKRTRLTFTKDEPSSNEVVDVGILLATLPPSAHLPILLQILRNNPSLSASILHQIPRPDLRSCINELESSFDRIRKLAGPLQPAFGRQPVMSISRRWDRVRGEADAFCRTASTFIRFITTRAPGASTVDSQTLFSLLHPVTSHLLSILALIPHSSQPASGSQSSAPIDTVLDLAKLLLSTWNSWLLDLSSEVNEQGGMYPYSVVVQWANVIEQFASGDSVIVSEPPVVAHWSTSSTPLQNLRQDIQPLESSFRLAFVPIREQFVTRVGWLIGRSRPHAN